MQASLKVELQLAALDQEDLPTHDSTARHASKQASKQARKQGRNHSTCESQSHSEEEGPLAKKVQLPTKLMQIKTHHESAKEDRRSMPQRFHKRLRTTGEHQPLQHEGRAVSHTNAGSSPPEPNQETKRATTTRQEHTHTHTNEDIEREVCIPHSTWESRLRSVIDHRIDCQGCIKLWSRHLAKQVCDLR